MDTSVKMKRGLRRVEWGTSLGVLCDVIRRKWAVLMLEGDAFQGCFTLKGNEEKIIVLNVDVCSVAAERTAFLMKTMKIVG